MPRPFVSRPEQIRIRALYAAGRSGQAVADLTGHSIATIKRHVGADWRGRAEKGGRPRLIDYAKARELRVKHHLTIAAIAERYGVSLPTVYRVIKEAA